MSSAQKTLEKNEKARMEMTYKIEKQYSQSTHLIRTQYLTYIRNSNHSILNNLNN